MSVFGQFLKLGLRRFIGLTSWGWKRSYCDMGVCGRPVLSGGPDISYCYVSGCDGGLTLWYFHKPCCHISGRDRGISLCWEWIRKLRKFVTLCIGVGFLWVTVGLIFFELIRLEFISPSLVISGKVNRDHLFTYVVFDIVAILLAVTSFIFNVSSKSKLPTNDNGSIGSIFFYIVSFASWFTPCGIFFLCAMTRFDITLYEYAKRNRESTPSLLQKTHNTENCEFFKFVNDCVKNKIGINSSSGDGRLTSGKNTKEYLPNWHKLDRPFNNSELPNTSSYAYVWKKLKITDDKNRTKLKTKESIVDDYQEIFSFNRRIKKVFVEKVDVNNLSVYTEGESLTRSSTYYYKLIETKVTNLFVFLREYDYGWLTKFSTNLVSNVISLFKYLFDIVVNLMSYYLDSLLLFYNLGKSFIEKSTSVKTIWELIEFVQNLAYQIVVNLKVWFLGALEFVNELIYNFCKNCISNFMKIVSRVDANFVIESKLFQIFRFILDILYKLRISLLNNYSLYIPKVSKIGSYNLIFKDVNIIDKLIIELDNKSDCMYRSLAKELEKQEIIKKEYSKLSYTSINNVMNSFKCDLGKNRYLDFESKFKIYNDANSVKLEDEEKSLFMNELKNFASCSNDIKRTLKVFLEYFGVKTANVSTSVYALKLERKREGWKRVEKTLFAGRPKNTLAEKIRHCVHLDEYVLISFYHCIAPLEKRLLKDYSFWRSYFDNNPYKTRIHNKLIARLDDFISDVIRDNEIDQVFAQYSGDDSTEEGETIIDIIYKILNSYAVEFSKIKKKLHDINDSVKCNSVNLQDFILNSSCFQTSTYSKNLELIVNSQTHRANLISFGDFYEAGASANLFRVDIYLVSLLLILSGSFLISVNSWINRSVILSSDVLGLIDSNFYYRKILYMRSFIISILYSILITSMLLLFSDLHMGSSFFSFYGCSHGLMFYILFWVFGSIEICTVIIIFLYTVSSILLKLPNKCLFNFILFFFWFCIAAIIILFIILE